MGVFAVAQALLQGQLQAQGFPCSKGGLLDWGAFGIGQLGAGGHPGADGAVVAGGVAEGFQGQLAAQVRIDPAGGQGGQEGVVLAWAGEHRHIGVVFRRGTHHGWAADVDVFDRRGPAHSGIGHRFTEGIEVDHHHIDRIDCLGGQVGLVGGVVALGQDAAMDAGVQGLDPAAEDFGSAGVLSHPGHG